MKNERILSYNLAHELSKDEINCVSGAGSKMTVITTQKLTGGQGAGHDYIADVTFDG